MHDKAILVVGSDFRLRAEIGNCLRGIGLPAVALAMVNEVPSLLTQLRFDAAVLEINPHRNNYDASVLSIRRVDPQCRIIVVSDTLTTPIEQNLRVLGVRQIVRKPVGMFRLYQAIVAVLGGRDASRSAAGTPAL